MTKIPCPACNASGVICSTCGGKRFVSVDGPYNWRDFTETPEDWSRVDADIARSEQRKRKRS
jgi:hypothetical protein